MPVYLATKTKELIDKSIEQDQGSKYREWLGKVIPTISDAFDPKNGRRSHMGLSNIGDPCARKLFFAFRWVTRNKHNAKLLRLFNRGHLEEGRFIAALLTAGLTVYQQDSNGKQFRITEYGGHIGSAIDGVVIGCPDLPDPQTAILTEMKTHNEKSFNKLVKEGVKDSKPIHYIQMQVYMRKMGLPMALYIAVNKNTDDMHYEIVVFEPVVADQYIDRGIKIAASEVLPIGLSDKGAGWFECRYCEFSGHCYRGDMPIVSCRTCAVSEVRPDGTWHCRRFDKTLSVDDQTAACTSYHVASYYG